MHEKICVGTETLDPSVMERLAKYSSTMEAWHCQLWVQKFLFKLIGCGIGYIDFGGKSHKSDVFAYGATLQDAAEKVLVQLEK